MDQYKVTGMSCAACSARVEKAVLAVPGVDSCSVSLLTNSMGVEGSASEEAILKAVSDAGYQAEKRGRGSQKSQNLSSGQEELLRDTATPLLKKRLCASMGFLLLLMYVSMGHMLFQWPLPPFLEGNHVAMGLLELLLAGIVMVINQRFFINGFRGLVHKAPNMDTLVALGSLASFLYSTVMLFAMTEAQRRGDLTGVSGYMQEFYFESAAMILTLITVGKMLEARSKGKTTDALKSLIRLTPKTARVVREGKEEEIPITEVRVGDLFAVRPGETIPVDGIVEEGSSAVNESALTGESIPVDKNQQDPVSAGTLNQSGYLICRADKVGEDTALAHIIQLVSDAAATKAPIARAADRVSGVFVPAVMGISLLTILIWLLAGESFGFALARGISVLVISCPCALGLATPVAIMAANGVGARNGILFKTAASLENAGRTEIIALDKTGTITIGKPEVTDVIAAPGLSEALLLETAYALESKSEHPLAAAVTEYAGEINIPKKETEEFLAFPGNGLTAKIDGKTAAGGKLSFIQNYAGQDPAGLEMLKKQAETLSKEGKTPLYFAYGNKLCGMIAVADRMREESPQAIRELRNLGIRVVMLTGDNELTAGAVGKQAGVDEVIAGVLPDGKEEIIRRLKAEGKTAMVGDGINDAPALTRADIGIAIGAGTDVAIDAASVVLMKSSLSDVPAAIRLSRAALRNIYENLFWAFFYNVIGIPLAAGVWIPLFSWKLNPMFGAAAMSLSSFCVVSNALRLNLLSIYSAKKDKKIGRHGGSRLFGKKDTSSKTEPVDAACMIKTTDSCECSQKESEEMKMTKTMKITGMMCMHCEARVKKTLEAIPQVEKAEVSHEKGTAVVTLTAEIADEVLKAAVEAQDYQVTGIE